MSDVLQLIAKLSVPTFIVSSMLAVGLELTPRAIVAPLRSPKLVLVAVLVNFVLSPAIAYLLTLLVPLERPYAIGLLLLSLAAGAPFLPKLAEGARADLQLAVSLMALLTMGTIVVMPFALPLLVRGAQSSPWTIAKPLLLLMALPLIAAMAVRPVAPALAEACRPLLKAVSSASLMLLLVLFVGLNLRALWGVVGSGAIAVAAVYVALVYAAGFLLGGRRLREGGAIGLASAARNVGAALPAASAYSDPKVIVMLLVATLTELLVLLIAAGVLRRRALADLRQEVAA